jgi:DNA-directed RNA polymerase specialized sigma24 family protein
MGGAQDQSTHASLLAKLQDSQDAAAWLCFFARYRPMIEDWCRGCGLSDADRDDVVGMVLLKIAERMQRGYVYDPRRTFRGWLRAVVVSQVGEFKAQKYRQVGQGSGDSGAQEALEQLAAPERAEDLERDLEGLLQAALTTVKERLGADSEKWQSFWLTAVEKQRGSAVARRLGLTVAAVHQNKHRVLVLIREEAARRRDEAVPPA